MNENVPGAQCARCNSRYRSTAAQAARMPPAVFKRATCWHCSKESLPILCFNGRADVTLKGTCLVQHILQIMSLPFLSPSERA